MSALTRQEVLALSGAALTEAVGEHVMGWHRAACAGWPLHKTRQPWMDQESCLAAQWDWRPHRDIAAAWGVFLVTQDWLFSQRKRFFDEWQGLTTHVPPGCRESVTVAWPDVLCVLRDRMPESICRAALLALVIE